ncbi:MAG TPA: SAM-dependent methyltransferase [Blastocatellia bacterium]|jgi:SAM-dependent MidA family methyltransferase|nr:SAM-dependent methyltransferase [Blastocatellia bacterium]
MTTEATVLERKLIGRIRRGGALTFRDFMQAALYDPEHGYYNTARAKIGPDGDYYTSGNVHPAFGAVLARAFVELWGESSLAAERFTIVEMGAGTGQLACDILTAMRDERPAAFDQMSYVIVELSPAMLERQRDKLAGFDRRVRWRRIEEVERDPIAGIFFSNELVDAMPVHRVRFTRSRIEELYVTAGPARRPDEEERLALMWAGPSSGKLTDYVERATPPLLEGQIVEVNLDAVAWLARLSQAIRRGFLVTIDYGDLAAHLCGPDRAGGTLRSFRNHRLVDSPLERVGEQDITASVNFTALIEYGRDFGFEAVSYERQTAFLIRMGLIERVAAMYDGGGSVDDLKERLAVKNLFVPGGVGDNFRVLVQKQSAGGGKLAV